MVKKQRLDIESLAQLIVKEVDISGEVRGSVACQTYGRRTSDDRPFSWLYTLTNLSVECYEAGNDGDESESRNMTDRALEYLESKVSSVKLFNFQRNGAKFRFSKSLSSKY